MQASVRDRIQGSRSAAGHRPRRRNSAGRVLLWRSPPRRSLCPRPDDWIAAAERDQVAVQRERGRVMSRSEDPACCAQCSARHGRGNDLHIRTAQARKVGKELPSSLGDRTLKFGLWSAKYRNGDEAANSCPWNSSGVPGAEQRQRRHRAKPTRRRGRVQPWPNAGVGDLVVVLQEGDERRGGRSKRRRAAPFFCQA